MKKKLSSSLAASFALAATLASPPAAADAVKGDGTAGGRKVAMCIGCHGIPDYKASFPEIYKVPKIAGQNAAYLAAALAEYKKGERKHPTMRAIATTLTEQDIADVASYYEQLGRSDGAVVPAQPPAPPEAVAQALQSCTACHGANFNTPQTPAFPKLAGQHADYLYAALKAYQTHHNSVLGRDNPTMMGMAATLTHPQIKQIASYLASLPSELKTVPQSRFR